MVWEDIDGTEINDEPEYEGTVVLTREEAEIWSQKIVDYFNQFKDVTDYYMNKKLEKLESITDVDELDDWDDDTEESYANSDMLFDGYSIEPKDMDIVIEPVIGEFKNQIKELHWNNLTQITATFPIEVMMGRNLKFLVKENNSGKYLGFLRLGGPTLNMGPRNKVLGEVLDANLINPNIFNGTVIVPAQPFGYNMLGGKLMALICNSNEIREHFDNYYGTSIKYFETTSLYGSIKGVSQYDGLKPIMRYGGDTDSKFPMILEDSLHKEFIAFFRSKDPKFTENVATGSIKLKIYMKMLGILKKYLKETGSDKYEYFLEELEKAQNLNTKKRYYYSDYGVENLMDVMKNNATPKYKQGVTRETFDLENIINRWKKMAQKRYDKLKSEGKIRTELEYWTPDRVIKKEIDIIR